MKQCILLLMILALLASNCLANVQQDTIADSDSHWLDRSHDVWYTNTQKAAQWFDQFFGDLRDQDEQATMRTRITLGWEPSEGDTDSTYARIRVKIRLPNLKRRFDLLFSNDEVDDFNLLPLEANRPQQVSGSADNNFNAALRWTKLSTLKETIDLRVGVHSGPDIYLYGRHRRQHNFSDSTKLRLTPSFFLDTKHGVGGRLLAEFDYLLEHPGVVRLSGRGQLSDKTDGLEWRGGLSYMYRFSPQGAVVSGLYLNGSTDGSQGDAVKNYAASIRLRNQFWRPYLFYEVEPYIDWPESKRYKSNVGITLRLNIVIGE